MPGGADWTKPTTLELYTNIITELIARDEDVATLFFGASWSSIPTHSIRYNRGTSAFQEWDGAVWNDLSLGLGTMAVQNSNAVAITGGTIGGAVTIDASRLTSGTIATARLGSGTADAHKFLRGDQSWASPVPIGTVAMWLTGVPPTDYAILNGQQLNRVTYADLFALWGTTFGVGDGATTFNIADMRGFFPFGKAAAGTGSGAIGSTFGSIDHLHSGPNHTHTITVAGAHTHTVAAHQHTITGVGTHTHGINFASGLENADVDVQAGGGSSVAAPGHFHGIIGATDGDGAHDHGAATGNASPATDNQGNHDHGGATGLAGTGNTGTGNPPGFVLNFIVKVL